MPVYPIVLSQNKFTQKDSLTYPFEERGLQFGDGVYEVIRIYHGSYYLLEEHVARLFRSAEAIQINLSFNESELADLLLELIEQNQMISDGKVYIQVTRGSAPRDHIFPDQTVPNIYAYLQDLPRNLESLEKGVTTLTVPDIRWKNCYIKSLNLLPNVLAKQEAHEHGCFEAILHKDGLVTEGSASNIYMVKNGKIYTHPATRQILHGCVRMRVEDFSKKLHIPFIEEGFTLEDIKKADELFLTSSTTEITPIIKVDGNLINDGKPGLITRQLQQAYEQDARIGTTVN